MTKDQFISLLPKSVYCADDVSGKKSRLPAEDALKRLHIQPNSSVVKRFLIFDHDGTDPYGDLEASGLPLPNILSVNKQNGHSHMIWMLQSPVIISANASLKPLWLMKDINRGMQMQLKSDRGYNGIYCKNPFHPEWETHWLAQSPYTLGRLLDFLPKKVLKQAKQEPATGIGRNCDLFLWLRKKSYRIVLKHYHCSQNFERFFESVMGEALELNQANFPVPLPYSEVKSIAKSVAKWTWGRFNPDTFSAIQKRRRAKRNVGPMLKDAKPWEAEGVSERTWFRRKAKARTIRLIPDMVDCQPQREREYILKPSPQSSSP